MSSKTLSSLLLANNFLPPPSFSHQTRLSYSHHQKLTTPFQSQKPNKVLCLSNSNSDTHKKEAWNSITSSGAIRFIKKRGHFTHSLQKWMEDEGKELRSFVFENVDPSQEVRAVERRVLLQTLAEELPPDTEPKYSGHCAIRGLAVYSDGQPHLPQVSYLYGRGIRAGFVPVSSTKVYWFICFNRSSPGPKVSDPLKVKREALDLVKNWSSELLSTIELTTEDSIIRSALEDRWLWPTLTPPVSKGGVVLAGDAWHPMTPNLGQGGCCALEDAIVLAKKLSREMKYEQGSIEDAMKSYGDERWGRVFPLTIRANLVGGLLQWENPVVCAVRNGIVIPKVAQIGPLSEF
ncbi:Monooxygenase 2 [Bienertia sinuspersici]